MPRTIWKGSLSFGLVNIPVGLYTATSDKTIHFNQFEEGTSDRIRYKKVNERTGEEVSNDRIVKGVDLGGGQYVILTDQDLEAAAPEKTRTIDITDFVDLESIDPVYYRTTYYLAPDGEAAAKAYALLRRAMGNAKKVGIATVVMRNKEYLVAIRPESEVLALETMYFSDEVRAPADELPRLGVEPTVSKKEEEMAQLLIESMEAEWDPEQYRDTYRERVQSIIEDKAAGKEITYEEPEAPVAPVADLMEILSASIARSSGAKRPGRASKAPATKHSASKSATKAAPSKAAKKSASTRAAKAAPAAKTGAGTTKAPRKVAAPKRKAS